MKKFNKFISMVLVIAMMLTFSPLSAIADAEDYSNETGVTVTPLDSADIDVDLTLNREIEKIYSDEDTSHSDDEIVRAIIVLNEKPVIEYEKSISMFSTSSSAQSAMRRIENEQESIQDVIEREVLDGQALDVDYKYSYTINAIAAKLTFGELKEIRNLTGVKYAMVSAQYHLFPMTADSSKMVGAQGVWAEGYDGTGMRIAVIDSGIDTDHPSFSGSGINLSDSDKYLTSAEVGLALPTLNANKLGNGDKVITSDDLYVSDKIPFGYNYIDRDLVVDHTFIVGGPNSHGSHVAGIAAANAIDTTDVIGIAHKAQIIAMRVFGINGGAYTTDIIAAIEDALLLNVDVVNLSLGSDAGFTHGDIAMETVLDRASQTDVILCMAAGNSTSSSYGNIRGTDTPLTSNQDNGIVSSPGAYANGLQVASLDNTVMTSKYVQSGNDKFAYVDSGNKLLSFDKINSTANKYVIIGNPETGEGIYGLEEDFPSGDFSDCVAVVSRGESTFAQKHTNAANAGFAGILIYNNRAGTFGASVEGSNSNISVAAISQLAGAKMFENSTYDSSIGAYAGELYISKTAEKIPSESAWQMSSFSSWGTTPDLKIKPEISGVGGNINSTVDSGYAMMSGTSMATPQVAGMAALLLEHLREKYPQMSEIDRRVMAQSLLMSTAVVAMSDEEEDLPYSPRIQGSGLGNISNSINSKAYLSVDGSEKPKVELGDDKAKSGVYKFTFNVNNMGKEALNYTLKTYTLTEEHYTGADGLEYMAQAPKALSPEVKYIVRTAPTDSRLDFSKDEIIDTKDVWMLYKAVAGGTSSDSKWAAADFNEDGIVDSKDIVNFLAIVNRSADYQMFEGDGTQITVPAGGAEIDVTITLSAQDKAYMDSVFENGIYVDGFVKLEAVENEQDSAVIDLVVPFLAFYGDWTAAPLFDNAYGADTSTWGEREILYPNMMWDNNNYIIGENPYVKDDEYIPERSNVISPDGSGRIIKDYYLTLLRGARTITTTIEKENGEIIWNDEIPFARKSVYDQSNGVAKPMSWQNEHAYDSIEFWPTMSEDTENESKFVFRVKGELDYHDVSQQNNKLNEWSMAVRVDEVKPTLDEKSIDLVYKPLDGENGSKTLSFTVEDDQYVAAVVVLNSSATKILSSHAINQTEPKVKTDITIDVSDVRSKLILAVCDYGLNTSYYEVDFKLSGGGDFDNTKLFGYRLGNPNRDPVAWVNFDTEDYTKPTIVYNDVQLYSQYIAAEYYDEFVYAFDVKGNFYALPFDGLGNSRTKIASFNFKVGDMTYDYSSNVMLGLADSAADDSGKNYMSVVALDHKDYIPNKDYEVAFKVARPAGRPDEDDPLYLLTLACTLEGDLYGIGYEVPVVDENGDPVIDTSTNKQRVKSGDLYYLGKYSDIKDNLGQVVHAQLVGYTGYNPNATQSMAFDHNTETLYWAKAGGTTLNFAGNMLEIDVNTGKATDLGKTDAQISGLFVPYKHPVTDSDPVTSIMIEQGDKLNMKVGVTVDLTLQIVPWTADKNIIWESDNSSVATVDENGKVTTVGDGIVTITAKAKTNPSISDSIIIAVKELDVNLGGYMVARDPNVVEEIEPMYGWGDILTNDIIAIESGPSKQAVAAGTVIDNELFGFSAVKYDFGASCNIGTYMRYDMDGNQISEAPVAIKYKGTKGADKFTDVTYDSASGYAVFSFGTKLAVAKTSGTAIDADGLVVTDLYKNTGIWDSKAYNIVGVTYGESSDILYCIDNLGSLYKAILDLNNGSIVSLTNIGKTGVMVNSNYGGILMNSMCYNDKNGMLYFSSNAGAGVSTASIKINAIDPNTATAFLVGQTRDIIAFGSIYIIK